jgi:phage/plasmid-like protein (TIGR03299 family)
MSHNLDQDPNTGQVSFVNSELTPAWHGLGTNLGKKMVKEEVLALSGLDYQVVKKPIFYHRNMVRTDGVVKKRYYEIPDRFETLRTDRETHLGIVGNRYEVMQNESAFDFFEEIVKEGEMIYDTVGVIDEGRIVWVMAKMPDYVTVKNDPIEKYMLFVNSHDGSMPITAGLTPIRVVCNNTLRWAINKSAQTMVKIRHTSKAMDRLREARRVLGIASEYFNESEMLFGEMAGFKMNTELVNKYFKLVIPDPVPKPGQEPEEVNTTRQENIREELVEIYETSEAHRKHFSIRQHVWSHKCCHRMD